MKFAHVERSLGEVDRCRGIFTHAAQFANPSKSPHLWVKWRGFEIAHGNVETFREMLRLKRSVEAQFMQVHFNAANISEVLPTLASDPMTEAEAAALKKRIAAGEAFDVLAKKYSTCPSKKRGGDLGEVRPGQMVRAIDQIIFKKPLKVVHGPVKSQFGYHLVQVFYRD